MNLQNQFFVAVIALSFGCHTQAYNTAHGGTLVASLGMIQTQQTQAIVNAANPKLAHGKGICDAIFKAAGPQQLALACNAIPLDSNGDRCPTGEARITASFNMQAQNVQHIIHAVGPDCRQVTNARTRKQLLAGAITNSLKVAAQNNIVDISFPFISSGIYAPKPADEPEFKEFAARAHIEAVLAFMEGTPTSVKNVTFVLINQQDLTLFTTLLAQYSTDAITLKLSNGQGQPQWNKLLAVGTIGTMIFSTALWLLTRKKQAQAAHPQP